MIFNNNMYTLGYSCRNLDTTCGRFDAEKRSMGFFVLFYVFLFCFAFVLFCFVFFCFFFGICLYDCLFVLFCLLVCLSRFLFGWVLNSFFQCDPPRKPCIAIADLIHLYVYRICFKTSFPWPTISESGGEFELGMANCVWFLTLFVNQ